jgi:hypothetical protein
VPDDSCDCECCALSEEEEEDDDDDDAPDEMWSEGVPSAVRVLRLQEQDR